MQTNQRKKILVPLAPGFEEIETITIVDILRRSGANVVIAGIQPGMLEGSKGIIIKPDCLLGNVEKEKFDLIILPGGLSGTNHLKKNSQVLEIIKLMNERKKIIGAICAAPAVLQCAGILNGRKVTSHPSVKEQLTNVQYLEDRVVVDDNIITSRSPGTAMEFAMKLVEVLFGPNRVNTINIGVMARL